MPKPPTVIQVADVRPLDSEVEGLIYVVRGRRVMFDVDLARLYGVTTRRLNEQVRRNLGRFPDDFLFQLTIQEADAMRSQIATASPQRWFGQSAGNIEPRRPSLQSCCFFAQ
jgi:hypothetical protein